MNKYPLVEILVFFCRYLKLDKPEWRKKYVMQLKRVRSCYSKVDGGVKKNFYSIETRSGQILDIVFNEEELVWDLMPSLAFPAHVMDQVLALVKRNEQPSRAHRIIPYRFEVIPKEIIADDISATELPLADRMAPYRFHSGKVSPTQVIKVVTRHLENLMVTKHLHYVVESDNSRFFHLFFILDKFTWHFVQEVDEELFFVK